jgi:hypothetical protein
MNYFGSTKANIHTKKISTIRADSLAYIYDWLQHATNVTELVAYLTFELLQGRAITPLDMHPKIAQG